MNGINMVLMGTMKRQRNISLHSLNANMTKNSLAARDIVLINPKDVTMLKIAMMVLMRRIVPVF